MKRTARTRLLAATTVALLAAGPAAPVGATQHTAEDPNRAGVLHLDHGTAQGWRTDRHLRLVADVGHYELAADARSRADVIGFGDRGVHVSFGHADGTLSPSDLRLADFGRNQGWHPERHPRRVADVDGDLRRDIVGFGERGLHVSYGNRYGSLNPALGPERTLQDFGAAQGWRPDRHLRRVADLDGGGRAAVVGFGDDGVHVAVHGSARSSGEFSPATLRVADFGWNQGWRTDRHVRELADVTGDGLLDVVGFGDRGVQVAQGRADGTFSASALVLRDFGHAQGWRVGRHPRHVADVNADGRADVVGFGHAGVWVAHGRTDGTFGAPSMTLRDLGEAQGWRSDRHDREVVDLNGDGRAEIVAFGDAGTYSSWSGFDGNFAVATLDLRNYGWQQGWRPDRHVRRIADVTGDGLPEIVGFGERGTLVTDWLGPHG
ncbi:FG-GAP repeat domain-containing protein [Kocuria sp. M1R5S2]|uniref:FG-GAP repeat domain-containing protein n=1 Tax=Kocuria rhizosphaerae TaxID=3376285 RepID=UPI0037B17C4A